MRKRLIVGIAIALAVGLLASALLLLTLPAERVTHATVDRIQIGMTEAEVEAILGGPASPRQTVSVNLDIPGQPVRAQKNWPGYDGVAVVAFSPEGTVVWKHFAEF